MALRTLIICHRGCCHQGRARVGDTTGVHVCTCARPRALWFALCQRTKKGAGRVEGRRRSCSVEARRRVQRNSRVRARPKMHQYSDAIFPMHVMAPAGDVNEILFPFVEEASCPSRLHWRKRNKLLREDHRELCVRLTGGRTRSASTNQLCVCGTSARRCVVCSIDTRSQSGEQDCARGSVFLLWPDGVLARRPQCGFFPNSRSLGDGVSRCASRSTAAKMHQYSDITDN